MPDVAEEIRKPTRTEDVLPCSVPKTVRVYHAKTMGAVFVNENGRSRQQVIGTLTVGDVVVCRALPASDRIGLFTVTGEQMGFLDTALVREIRTVYPHHRIGAHVERISGGDGVPFTCHVCVAVFGTGV